MLSILGRLAACAFVTWLVYLVTSRLISVEKAVPLTLVWSAPVWAIAFAKYLLDVLPAIRRKAARDALEPWNGRYYVFDTRQLRLFLIDEVIWVPSADVATLLEPAPDARELRVLGGECGRIPGQKMQGYTEAGLLRLLATRCATRRATHEAIRFKHWLQTEAFPNLRRLPSSAT